MESIIGAALTLVIILVGLALFLILFGVGLYNRLVAKRNQVENGWRQIDVQLKRRHDLIPNLVNVVKDFMGYEQETLQAVIAARSRAVDPNVSDSDHMKAEGELSQALGRLFALTESYPDLKSNQQANRLMEELSATENRIAFARQHYNDSVMNYNTRVQSVPSNIIAGLFQFKTATLFEIPDAERATPQVRLR